MRLTLKPALPNETFQRIVQGKRWVGRVYRNANTGRFHGKIGEHTSEAGSAVAAFDEVGARFFGHKSAADLRDKNAAVRRDNRIRRDNARAIVAGLLSSDARTAFAALDELLNPRR